MQIADETLLATVGPREHHARPSLLPKPSAALKTPPRVALEPPAQPPRSLPGKARELVIYKQARQANIEPYFGKYI